RLGRIGGGRPLVDLLLRHRAGRLLGRERRRGQHQHQAGTNAGKQTHSVHEPSPYPPACRLAAEQCHPLTRKRNNILPVNLTDRQAYWFEQSEPRHYTQSIWGPGRTPWVPSVGERAMARGYNATLEVKCWKEHTCCYCGAPYRY